VGRRLLPVHPRARYDQARRCPTLLCGLDGIATATASAHRSSLRQPPWRTHAAPAAPVGVNLTALDNKFTPTSVHSRHSANDARQLLDALGVLVANQEHLQGPARSQPHRTLLVQPISDHAQHHLMKGIKQARSPMIVVAHRVADRAAGRARQFCAHRPEMDVTAAVDVEQDLTAVASGVAGSGEDDCELAVWPAVAWLHARHLAVSRFVSVWCHTTPGP
jgi:hypothetical protein